MSTETWSAESFRELTDDLDPLVVAAGPPPVPELDGRWRIRVADPDAGDAKLVADWMARPHVDLFWEQNWPVERWEAVLRRQLAGACTLPLIASRDDVDLAYLEVYRTPRDVVGKHYPAGAYDLGVHIAVGEPEATDRGFGRELMAALANGLFAADARCERVLVDPDARHAMARRMFAAAGFELIAEVDLGHKSAALMSYSRPALLP